MFIAPTLVIVAVARHHTDKHGNTYHKVTLVNGHTGESIESEVDSGSGNAWEQTAVKALTYTDWLPRPPNGKPLRLWVEGECGATLVPMSYPVKAARDLG